MAISQEAAFDINLSPVEPDSHEAALKYIYSPEAKRFFYYIKLNNGLVYNPFDDDIRQNLQWKLVNEVAYGLFVKFLMTQNKAYLFKIEKELV